MTNRNLPRFQPAPQAALPEDAAWWTHDQFPAFWRERDRRQAALRTAALRLWRTEVRRGAFGQRAAQPATWRLDALWRAACWEATGDPARARATIAEARAAK